MAVQIKTQGKVGPGPSAPKKVGKPGLPSKLSGPRTGKKVKTHWHVGIPAHGKPSRKQQKMGHAKVERKATPILCPWGHKTSLVHLYGGVSVGHYYGVRRWCETCQEGVL